MKSNSASAQKSLKIFLQKTISLLLIFILLVSQIVYVAPPALGDPEKTKVNLVVLLVEDGLVSNSTPYEGLKLYAAGQLGERVTRYAQDIQLKLENTKVDIFRVVKDEDPYEIAKVLEKLYFEGDGTQNQINNLEGVVLVGDIPLPTVKKGSYTYRSIYPYTDFQNKEFLYNTASGLFEETSIGADRQPEIWHGVIKPPVGGEEGNKLLAEYFDKNHAFYQKAYGYADFDRKVFFSDFQHEKEKVQGSQLGHYQAFIDHLEDFSYLRYTKALGKSILKATQAESQANLLAGNINTNINALNQSDFFDQVPDIFIKQMIDPLIARFYKLFGDYPGTVRGWIDASGRWKGTESDTFYRLISEKDEFSMRAIRKANDTLETATDDLVSQMQKNIRMVTGADFATGGLFGDGAYFNNYINGVNADLINTAIDCTIYRGTDNTGEKISQSVEANRVYNPLSESNSNLNFNTNVNGNTCPEYGGCCARYINFVDGKLAPSPQCKPQDAVLPVLDLAGTLPRQGDTSYRACLVENYAINRQKKYNGKDYTDYKLVAGTQRYKEIPSIIYHKEPTSETLSAQLKAKTSLALPVDNPRYVDFQNQRGEYQSVRYVNFFDLKADRIATVEQAKTAITDKIQKKEKELDVQQLLEKRLKDDISIDVVADAVVWLHLTPQEKYDYVFRHYLSVIEPSEDGIYHDVYPTKPKGYESMYLNVTGDSKFLDLSFTPSSDSGDSDFQDLRDSISLQKSRDESRQALENLLQENGIELDASCGSFDGVSIFEWFQALLCWLKNLVPPKLDFYDGGGSTFDASKNDFSIDNDPFQENNTNESPLNGNRNRNANTNTNTSPPAQTISLSAPDTAFNLVDRQTGLVSIQMLDQNGKLWFSNESQKVDLTLLDQKNEKGEPDTIFQLGEPEPKLQGGTATVVLTPLKAGSARLTAGNGTITSNVLELKVSNQKLGISLSSLNPQGDRRYGTTFAAGSDIDVDFELLHTEIPGSAPGGVIRLSASAEEEANRPEISNDRVVVHNGVAEAHLKIGKKTGSFVLQATFNGSNGEIITSTEKVNIRAGNATTAELKVESPAVIVGETTQAALLLYDAFGNSAGGDFHIDLFANENGIILDQKDRDNGKEGINTTVIENSRLVFAVKANTVGTLNVKAHIQELNKDVSGSISIVKDDLRLRIEPEQESVPLKSAPLGVKLAVFDAQGNPVSISKDIALTLNNDIASLTPGTVHLENGKGQTSLVTGTRAGEVQISAPAITSEGGKVTVKSEQPYQIHLTADKTSLEANGTDTTAIEAQVQDQYGNIVTDFNADITLQITEPTIKAGTLDKSTAKAQNGIARFTLSATLIAGEIHLIAAVKDIRSGVLSMLSQRKISADLVKNIDFNALYMTLPGNPAGDVSQNDYLGGWMLFNAGKTQSITTLITAPEQPKQYVSISSKNIEVINEEPDLGFNIGVLPHEGKPLQIDISAKDSASKLASVFLEVPKKLAKKLVDTFSESTEDGIYLIDTDPNDPFTIREEGDRIGMYIDNQLSGRLFSDNTISISSPLIITLNRDESSFFTFDIIFQDQVVGQIQYHIKNARIQKLDETDTITDVPARGPGVYVLGLSQTLPLTETTNGFALTKTGETEQIDESFISVEDAGKTEGIGFVGDFKNQLLFAAGNTVGESTKLYASSLLINLGDPIISLPQDNQTGLSGFSSDIGQVLGNYQNGEISKLLSLDYNKDGQKDLLVILKNGSIDLFQNYNDGRDFKPMGTLMSWQDGIVSSDTGDINHDGWDDLLISTGSGKIAMLINTQGAFVRQDLILDVRGKVTDLKLKDMDADGKLDLLTSDDSGDIKIFYGTDSGLENTPYLVDNLGIKVSDINLNNEPAVYFEGVAQKDPKNMFDERFVTMQVQDSRQPKADSLQQNANSPGDPDGTSVALDFFKLNLVSNIDSDKRIRDINSGTLQQGDEVEYTLTLTNKATTLQNMMLADVLPDFFALQNDSLSCENCGDFKVVLSSNTLYPILLSNITLEQGKTATIRYRAKVTLLPIVLLEAGDFEKGADQYLDIYARDNSGSSKTLLLYRSIAPREYKKETVDTAIETPPTLQNELEDKNNNGTPDQFEKDTDGDGVPDFAQDELDRWARDRDGDGVPNALDEFDDDGQSLDQITDSIRSNIDGAIDILCHGGGGGSGCLSLPLNYAFLAPGYNEILLPPTPITLIGPPTTGYPIFGLVPHIPFVCHGPSCFATSYFRFYVMPTLTGGLGTAACVSAYGVGRAWPPIPLTGNCFVYAVPLLDKLTGGLCSKINASVDQLLGSARSTSFGQGTNIFQVGYSFQNGTTEARSQQLTFDNGTFDIDAVAFKNTRIPDFPDFIMDWVHNEIDEIQKSLLDLPDIYLILPDFSGTFGELPEPDQKTKAKLKLPYKKKEVEIKYIGDVVDYLNALPFVRLRVDSVPIKYPYISPERIEQLQEYYETWIENAEEDLKSYGDSPDENTKIRVSSGRTLISRVRNNIKTLQSYADFPQEIEKFAQWKSRLIGQIVSYLDRISSFLGDYYLRNKARLIKWQELYRLIKEILKGWQLIPDLFQGYKNACSTCRNDRFNSMYWKLKLFGTLIPQLPVIPFPKWPDIVIDVSNINAVIDLSIPSPKFIPEEIIIPQLPNFRLPELSANIDGIIPSLPSLPSIPDLFPTLPPLPLPKLPDIPPPPKIPSIFGSIRPVLKVLQLALYIWCIYKKGLTLIPEWDVKGTVEHLTERSGFLPMDFLSVSFPLPRIPSVSRIRVDSFVNFKFNVNALTSIMETIAGRFNSFETNLLNYPNSLSSKVPQIPSIPPIDVNTQGYNDLKNALNELSQTFDSKNNQMLSVDEMQDFLLKELRGINDLPASPELADIQKHLSDAITTDLSPNIPETLPAHPETVALKNELVSLLAQNEHDLSILSQAVRQKKNLLAVSELKDWFYKPGAVFASDTMSEPAKVTTEKVLTNWSGQWPVISDQQLEAGSQQLEARESDQLTANNQQPAKDELGSTVNSQKLMIQDTASQLPSPNSSPRYLAQAPSSSSSSSNSLLPEPQVQLNGLYIYDDKTQTQEKLISYEAELSGEIAITTFDIDRDSDDDVVYAMNGTIYVKENRTSQNEIEHHIFDQPAVYLVSDRKVASPAVNYFQSQNSTNKTSVSWLPDSRASVIGYKLTLKNIINRFDLEKVENLDTTTSLIFFALPDQNAAVQKIIDDDASTFTKQIVVLSDTQNPQAVLQLPNGNYYGKIQVILADRSLGTISEIHLSAPQKYGDTTPPTALVAGGNVHEVAVLQSLTLDASVSRKEGDRIVQYFWDTAPDRDSNGDGLTTNDPDLFSSLPVNPGFNGASANSNNDQDANIDRSMSNPVITIGPFTEPGDRRIFLNVEDEAGNKAQSEVIIHVFVPDLKLDRASFQDREIRGHTEQPVENEPVAIVRVRDNQMKVVRTPSADSSGKYLTNRQGEYKITDFSNEKGLSVQDALGHEVATINEETGNIKIKDANYRVRAVAAGDNNRTSLLIEKDGEIMATIELTTNPNQDVVISDDFQDSIVDTLTIADQNPGDSIVVSRIPNNAPSFPGGAALYDAKTKTLLAMVGTNGDIRLFDTNTTLAWTIAGQDSERVHLEIKQQGVTVAHVFFPRLGNAIIQRYTR